MVPLLFICFSPRRPLFLHTLIFECITKLCINFSTNSSLFSHLNSAQHNLDIELCCAIKIIQNISRLFSKFAHGFVAIELLTFSKIQNSIFIAQESSSYLGFFMKNIVRKQYYFFCVHKTFHKTNFFLYI